MQILSHAATVNTSRFQQDSPAEPVTLNQHELDEVAAKVGSGVGRENVLEPKPMATDVLAEGAFSSGWSNEALEGNVRAAMIAAAKAVITPWLDANFGQSVERYLGGRVRELASELFSNRLLDEVPALVADQIGALEKRIGAAVTMTIAAGIEHALEPALSYQIVALESRMTAALGDQITKVLLKDLKLEIVRHLADAKAEIAGALPEQIAVAAAAEVRPAVSREMSAAEVRLSESLPLHVAAALAREVPAAVSHQIGMIETRMAAALPQQVASAIEREIGPAIESRVIAAESQINSAMCRHIRGEIGAAFRRLADVG